MKETRIRTILLLLLREYVPNYRGNMRNGERERDQEKKPLKNYEKREKNKRVMIILLGFVKKTLILVEGF